jgi:hypothetical protein
MSNLRWGVYPSRMGDVLLRQIEGVTINTGQTKSEPIPGGALDRSAIITALAEPTVRFRTGDLDGLWASSAKVDLQVGHRVDTVNATTTAATLLQFQRRVDGAGFNSGATVHYQITSTKGFAYVDELVAEQDSQEGAMVDVAYAALSTDGLVSPLSIAQDSAGLTSSPLYSGTWFLGPVMVGTVGSATALEGITRVRVRPGIEYRVKRSDGAVYGNVGMIHSRKPEVFFRVENVDEFYSRIAAFFGASIPTVAFYLQKGAGNSTRVPRATASHVRFVASSGEWSPDSFEVAGQDDVGVEIVFRPLTMTVACGVAIA